jgi:hypothetical protein
MPIVEYWKTILDRISWIINKNKNNNGWNQHMSLIAFSIKVSRCFRDLIIYHLMGWQDSRSRKIPLAGPPSASKISRWALQSTGSVQE